MSLRAVVQRAVVPVLAGSVALAVSGCAVVPSDDGSALAVRFAVVATMATTLGLLHCLLFAFESRDRRNLYFAVLAAAFALVVVLDYRERVGSEVVLPGIGALQRWAVSAVILAALRFAYSLFRDRAPRRFWVYSGLVVSLLLLAVVDRRLFDLPAGVLGLIVTLDALVSIVHGWRRLEREAWIVAFGAGLFSIGGIGQLVLDVAGETELGDALVPYLWGGLALLLAGSIYLARTFAQTRRQLEARLVEVQELSARALAQEQAARDEEVRRRLVEAENARQSQELEAARQLQLAMLPEKLPTLPGYGLAASMTTATEVGGDYYDAKLVPDGSLWLAVGDAVGHGARAGTLVTVAKSLFTGIATQPGPALALDHFDQALRGMGLQRAHLALTLARLSDGRLEIASAGMPPAILRRAGGEMEEIAFSSLPLGSPLRQPYASRVVQLAPGDLVLLLSDGLIELPGDDDGTPLGYEAVRDLVAQAPAAEDDLDSWLRRLVGQHVNVTPPPDDVTLLAVRARRAPRQ